MKIEGYFSNIKLANGMVDKLKNAGFDKAFVDIPEHYMDNLNVQTNLAGTETGMSLSGLVLEGDAHGGSLRKSPLNAASPMVSGIGRFDEIADVNCKIIVEADDAQADQVKKMIKDAGGELKSPYVKKPVLKDDREITLYNALEEIRREV